MRKIGSTSVFLGLLCMAAPAAAQDTSGNSSNSDKADGNAAIPEIIVTATRRAESAQNVPLSLSTFSGEALEQAGNLDPKNLVRSMPNMSFTQFRATEPTIFIRGVGTVLNTSALEPPTAIYIDDVYVGRAAGGLNSLANLERVEVLRGPQGTFFGRNVTGGAITYITKDPTHNLQYKMSGTYGNYDLARFQSYVSGGLSENVAANLSLEYSRHDGYATNLTSGDELENNRTISARSKIAIDVGSSSELKIGFDLFDSNSNGASRVPIINNGFGSIQADPIRSYFQRPEFGPGAVDINSWGMSAIFETDLSFADFKSISSYRQFTAREFQMVSSQPYNRVNNDQHIHSSQFQQEFRFNTETGIFDLVYGLFFFSENVVDRNDNTIGTNLTHTRSDVETRSGAAFFDGMAQITPDVRIGGGVRLTYDERNFDHTINLVGGTGLTETQLDANWTRVTGRAVVEWKPLSDKLIYASYNRGYKAGGFDTFARSPNGLQVIQPETIDNVEFGVKTDWLDNRLRLNAAAFYSWVKDVQLSVLADPIAVIVRTGNAGNYRSKGFEVNADLAPTDWISFSGNYGYTDAKFTSDIIIDSSGTNINGKLLPRTPKNTYSAAADLHFDLPSGDQISGNVRWSHTDEYFGDSNNVPLQLIPSFELLDANIGWTSSNDRYDVRLWALNLTNEEVIQQIAGAGGAPSAVFAPPRTYGITVTFKN